MWSLEGWKHGTERVLGGDCSTSALPLKPTRSLSWQCLQHIQLIPLRVAAKGGWKAPRHSKENVTFLSDVLICWCSWLKENKTGEKLEVFLFFYSFVQCILRRYLELALSQQHPLLDAGQTGPIIAQIPADFVQIFSSQQTPALNTELRLTTTCIISSICKTSLRLPALPNQSRELPNTPWELLWGNTIFFFPVSLALKGSETLQWWWGDTKSHFVMWGLQLSLVSWVVLGSWWEALGMWQRRDQGEDSPWVHPWPDRQTDRHTPFTVFIQMCHSQNTRQTSLYKLRLSKCWQAVHSHKWAGITAYTSPWSFQYTFPSFFFQILKYLYLQPPAPWKLFKKEKKD